MARITYVKHAQQRYATVPVLDPETGQQKRTPVMRTRRVRNDDGTTTAVAEQKVTKSGKPVFMAVTRADKTQPLPNRQCEKCRAEIKVGDPYKHITPKSGPYGGRTRYRCGACPGWRVWEYSNSLSARIEQITEEAADSVAAAEDADSVRAAFEEAAGAIRDLASEKEEAADNIVDGFGHDTYQSEELREQADTLNSWADDVEGADVPDDPEPEEDDCEECNGTGKADGDENDAEDDCEECDGSGRFTPDEPTEQQWDDWRAEVEDAAGVLDSPL